MKYPAISRVRSFVLYTAGAASVTATATIATIAASSLLMGGCVPCSNPNGCTPTATPQVVITLSPKAGTYAGEQTVNITAPGADAIYVSTNGATPSAANCTVWDGNPIVIRDSTMLNVFAKPDSAHSSKSLKAQYKLTSSSYTNRTALDAWLLLEKDALTSLYCANNGCTVPTIDFLLTEQHWTANCAGGGTVQFDNDPSAFASVFTYASCSSNGVTANGAVTLTLDAAKLPAVNITGSQGVILTGSGYGANITDRTLRKYALNGKEGARGGSYAVGCEGAGCATGDVTYFYGTSNSLWINDPAVPNSCTL
jgi:hypothetical protein